MPNLAWAVRIASTATAAFTNTKNVYGGLTVTKTVAGNAGETDREWNFTVTLSDTSISGTYDGKIKPSQYKAQLAKFSKKISQK